MNLDSVLSADFSAITHDVVFGHNADGSPYGVTIVGSDSQQYRAASAAQRAYGRKLRADAGGVGLDISTEAGGAQYDALVEANQTATACACVVSWFGFTSDGLPAAFDPDKVRIMLEKRTVWRDAVAAEIVNGGNFLPV